jgi:NDP-sugar pyrophosphorylase family protein
VSEVVICSGYKSEMIQNYLENKKLGVKITFSIESKPLGTGGAIKKAGKKIKDNSFIVINGDIITNTDLKKLVKVENSIASIQLRTKFGILQTDENKIMKFDEKKEITDLWMNAGIYHLKKETLKDLPSIGDIEKTLFPDYAKKEKLSTVKFRNAKWHSIDSYKDIEECSAAIEKIIK